MSKLQKLIDSFEPDECFYVETLGVSQVVDDDIGRLADEMGGGATRIELHERRERQQVWKCSPRFMEELIKDNERYPINVFIRGGDGQLHKVSH
jgi:hypothetical protein